MAYRYPRLCSWALFKYLENGRCQVFDGVNKRVYTVDQQAGWLLQQLDGKTDPYRLGLPSWQVEAALEYFDEKDLICYHRFALGGTGFLFSLFYPRATDRKRRIAGHLNRLLYCLFLPALIAGFYLMVSTYPALSASWQGSLVGAIVGLSLHELAHAIACLAYGGFVYEVGIGTSFLVVPIAYVIPEMHFIRDHRKKAQIHAAGVEMNFLLAGICAALASAQADPSFFFGAAMANAVLGCINLVLIGGMDGMHIAAELMGIEDLVSNARKVVLNGRYRRAVWRQGNRGKASVYLSFLVTLLQLMLPVFLISNIGGILSWFS